jgi:hypothetical protein
LRVDEYSYDQGVTIGAHVPVAIKRSMVNLAYDNRRSLSAEARVAFERHLETERSREASTEPALH